ncbi:MAG: hypothetical protein GKR89_05220 [Candidatus Latescibacteria bacterium]|nr:hypothetical protein [Candidatus Latescibacterota bacterium]
MPKTSPRRRKTRSRGATARANADIQAHIESLGLDTAEEYKAWCRQHGLNGALNKKWQERRKERDLVQRDQNRQQSRQQLLAHIESLGLKDEPQYTAWCRQHQISPGLDKSAAQRRKEKELAQRLQSQAALAQVRRHTKRPRDTIAAIFAGHLAADQLRTDFLKNIHRLAHGLAAADRPALLRLLLHTERHLDLTRQGPALAHLDQLPGNTLLAGLAALAHHHRNWLRPVEDWRPQSHNARRRFGALARHLLAQYEMPAFMDSAWFQGDTDHARRQQSWYKHLGNGDNIRTAPDLPVELTKKMAHLFHGAPADLTPDQALRWAQVLGLGGSENLARAILDCRLGQGFEDEAFWGTVVQFFANHAMLDPDYIGPIVDYIHNQKYIPEEIVLPGGQVEQRDPPQPNFSMKSRSITKLLDQVDRWHARLARETRVPPGHWAASGIGEYQEVEELADGRQVNWAVRELRSSRELAVEGRQLNHCVASYANNCQSGKISVWSLRLEGDQGAAHHIMTIAVNNQSRRITQVRGRHNVMPNANFSPGTKGKGLGKDYRTDLRDSRHYLHRWMDREQIRMQRSV